MMTTKISMDEFLSSANNVHTVEDLIKVLSLLPADMPIMQRGSFGNFREGVQVRVVDTFARHLEDAAYTGDMSDEVWENTKDFGKKFSGLLID
jgi:hypothetical protein